MGRRYDTQGSFCFGDMRFRLSETDGRFALLSQVGCEGVLALANQYLSSGFWRVMDNVLVVVPALVRAPALVGVDIA
jgi:hypothetical protein